MNVVFVVKVVGVVVGLGVDVGVGVGVGGDRRRISTVLFLIISLFLRLTRHMRGNCSMRKLLVLFSGFKIGPLVEGSETTPGIWKW